MKTIIKIDYESLIFQGIGEAQGRAEDIEHVRAEWLVEIGRRAVKRSKDPTMGRDQFPSWVVSPISYFHGVQFHVDSSIAFILSLVTSGEIVLAKLARGKKVYVVSAKRILTGEEYVDYLAEFGLKPCEHAPNYLLGLMAKVHPSDMPDDLERVHIIAADPCQQSSAFHVRGFDHFLSVCHRSKRDEGPNRSLSLHRKINPEWPRRSAFLAEEA
jgi:hypothetical protein